MKRSFQHLRLTIATIQRKAKHVAHEVLQGLCFFGGLAVIAYGTSLYSRPAGVMLGGLFAVWFSFLMAD
jgi:hypothetical protein